MPDKHPLDQLTVRTAFALSTLAASTGLVNSIADINQNYKAVSMHGVWSLTTLTAGDGPIMYGIADGEYSLAEIEQYLEATVVDKRDAPETEQVSRAVQVLGALGTDLQTVYSKDRVVLPTFREDKGFIAWVHNAGIAMTTGALLKFRGRFFGRWLD